MRERPILFNGPMVRAILEGRKTMTRRVIKPRPVSQPMLCPTVTNNGQLSWVSQTSAGSQIQICPYGEPGDHLWVRETWAHDQVSQGIAYRATDQLPDGGHWSPSIHMPRRASRIFLEVTSVRVERVQDITHKDALREGVSWSKQDGSPIDRFRLLWNSINAERGCGWDANPWVWVISFKRVSP